MAGADGGGGDQRWTNSEETAGQRPSEVEGEAEGQSHLQVSVEMSVKCIIYACFSVCSQKGRREAKGRNKARPCI